MKKIIILILILLLTALIGVLILANYQRDNNKKNNQQEITDTAQESDDSSWQYFRSEDDCRLFCSLFGYQQGSCLLSDESANGEEKVNPCLIKSSDKCGKMGDCDCWCWEKTPEDQPAGLANPASVYCEEQGGYLEMRETESGTTGYCVFEDGSECEEWSFYNKECLPKSIPEE